MQNTNLEVPPINWTPNYNNLEVHNDQKILSLPLHTLLLVKIGGKRKG
jgi:hypothetical protein